MPPVRRNAATGAFASWLNLAQQTDRQPVLLMSVESIDTISVAASTKEDWVAAETSASVNVASDPGNCSIDWIVNNPGGTLWGTDGPPDNHFAPIPDFACYLKKIAFTVVAGPFMLVSVPNTTSNISLYINGAFHAHLPCTILQATALGPVPDTFAQYYSLACEYTDTYEEILLAPEDTIKVGRLSFPGWSDELAAAYTKKTVINSFSVIAAAGTLRTAPLDLGLTPTSPSVFSADDKVSLGSSIDYSIRGSEDASTWVDLGPVTDGDSVAPYRYYDITCDFASDGSVSPLLREVGLAGGDAQFLHFSTHEDLPAGARPLLLNSLGSLGSKLELMKLGSTGEAAPKLIYRRETYNMLRDNRLRNKYVAIKHGFAGLAASEFMPLFAGLWHDGSIDLLQGTISVKTRTILARFQKAQLPAETATGAARTENTVVPWERYSYNIISMMLDIVDALGIPSRWIDMTAANALRTGARSGTDWEVSRRLDKDNKAAAIDLLEELSVLSGVFLVQGADGRLSFKLHDPAEDIVGEINPDICKFGAIELGQSELYTRQQIYSEPHHEGDIGTGTARGAWVNGADYAAGDTTGTTDLWYCLQPHNASAATAPGTGVMHRPYWAHVWQTGAAVANGDVRINGGPLYTCVVPHTCGPSTEPGRGVSWRSKWSTKRTKDSSSASDYYNAYILINQTAEVAWGLNKDVPPEDPDYQVNPGYQKNWYEKWAASPAAIAALAARMDLWFATPKMKLRASDLPPQYADKSRYQVGNLIGVTGLQLPVAGNEWDQLTDRKKFMIMANPFDPATCTVVFDLLEV